MVVVAVRVRNSYDVSDCELVVMVVYGGVVVVVASDAVCVVV